MMKKTITLCALATLSIVMVNCSSSKKTAAIPKNERLIMMIAVGNLLDEFSVAQSEKYPVEQIVRQH